jgi:hypothetical protein
MCVAGWWNGAKMRRDDEDREGILKRNGSFVVEVGPE